MKPYKKLLLVISLPLVLLLIYAFCPETISIGDMKLRKPAVSSFFATSGTGTSIINKERGEIGMRREIDSTAQRILFFGDSMVDELRKPFNDYAAQNGHTLTSVVWYSSASKHWAQTDTLEHFMREANPSYVVICLAANELFVKDLADRDAYIKRIVKKLGNLPYVWVSPPNWKEDTGINDLIVKNIGREHYFDSRHLKLQRRRDGAHPTPAASRVWMDSVAVWMNSLENAHPLLMAKPKAAATTKQTLHLLQPPKD